VLLRQELQKEIWGGRYLSSLEESHIPKLLFNESAEILIQFDANEEQLPWRGCSEYFVMSLVPIHSIFRT
jgi:hypothetical protein